ncbi:hypothetical protein FRC12_023000 [Ceratobasidium sp. 428]|nr:hypothetical protein FRC12_023000 [Ceratobasidium sp. 428]
MQKRFVYYLDINTLAIVFGMNELGVWAHTQLKVALQSSDSLASKSWKEDTLLEALECAYTTPEDTVDFEHDMLAFVYLVLSPSISSLQESKSGLNLDTCVELFKHIGFSGSVPELFGYVFAVILSLGHQSPVWKKKLTREDRAALYAAQVHLVCLRRHEGLSLQWLTLSRNLRPDVLSLTVNCHTCMKNLQAEWLTSFGQCANLNSEIPLHDISKIVLLPRYRQQIASAFRPAWKCPSKCGAGERILDAIDVRLGSLYTELAFEYRRIVREL